MKIRSNLPAQAEGTVSITFMYPGKTTNPFNPNGGPGLWNVYPPLPPGGQAFGDDLTPTGDGLPYNVVATQVGQTP